MGLQLDSGWFDGLKYAEEQVRLNGLEPVEEFESQIFAISDYVDDFDRGIRDYLRYYHEGINVST